MLYWAVPDREDPDSVQLVVNGVASTLVFAKPGWAAFSAKGDGWAAIAPSGPREEGPREEEGKEEEAKGPPRSFIAVGAKGLLGEHPQTSRPAVSPDGEHVAYIAADEEGSQSLFVDGALERRFGKPEVPHLPAVKATEEQGEDPPLAPETSVAYLGDGTLVGVALGEKGWTVFHGDESWATYPGIRLPQGGSVQIDASDLLTAPAISAGSLVVAESAPKACWWERMAGDAERWRVMCNGEPVDSQVCENASPALPITVAAGGAVAYVCQQTPALAPGDVERVPKNLWVVSPGERRGPYRFVWGVELSADGRHVAYAAADELDEPWFYVVDGRRIVGDWQQAFPPKLSPDGSTVVWAASREEQARRVDLVIDGEILTRAEMVMAPPRFRDDGSVQWAVKRGKSVRRLVLTPAPREKG